MSSLKSTTTQSIEAHQAGWQAFFGGEKRDNCFSLENMSATGWQNGWDAAHRGAIEAYALELHRRDIVEQIDAGEAMAREVLRGHKTPLRLRHTANSCIDNAHRLRQALQRQGDAA